MIIQYTTPAEALVVEGIDLTGCDVWVSFQQGARELDVKNPTVAYDGTKGNTTVTVELTQSQTAQFRAGKVAVQVNWITQEGARDATAQAELEWAANLLERVVEYGE